MPRRPHISTPRADAHLGIARYHLHIGERRRAEGNLAAARLQLEYAREQLAKAAKRLGVAAAGLALFLLPAGQGQPAVTLSGHVSCLTRQEPSDTAVFASFVRPSCRPETLARLSTALPIPPQMNAAAPAGDTRPAECKETGPRTGQVARGVAATSFPSLPAPVTVGRFQTLAGPAGEVHTLRRAGVATAEVQA